jgi:hypothetical protein
MTTPPAVHDGCIILCGVLAANPVGSVQLRAGASVHLFASLKWETSRLGACDGHCYLIMVEFFVRMKDTGEGKLGLFRVVGVVKRYSSPFRGKFYP